MNLRNSLSASVFFLLFNCPLQAETTIILKGGSQIEIDPGDFTSVRCEAGGASSPSLSFCACELFSCGHSNCHSDAFLTTVNKTTGEKKKVNIQRFNWSRTSHQECLAFIERNCPRN